MRRLLLGLLLTFCVCFAFGYTLAEQLKISTREERTQLTVTITLFSITPEYRWLSVYACSAEVYEHGTFCTGDFERESTQEVRQDQRQYLFPWRHLPRGTLQITSIAFDREGKALAKGQRTVLRH